MTNRQTHTHTRDTIAFIYRMDAVDMTDIQYLEHHYLERMQKLTRGVKREH